jgi:uncharacterized protein with HEPN domain
MKDPRILLQFMLECADLIARYVEGQTLVEFADALQTQDAVFRRLEVIGQAVKDLPGDVRDRYPEVPWRKIAGMRDVLSHDYLGVDVEVTWSTATVHVPELADQVRRILADLG